MNNDQTRGTDKILWIQVRPLLGSFTVHGSCYITSSKIMCAWFFPAILGSHITINSHGNTAQPAPARGHLTNDCPDILHIIIALYGVMISATEMDFRNVKAKWFFKNCLSLNMIFPCFYLVRNTRQMWHFVRKNRNSQMIADPWLMSFKEIK